MVANTTVPAGVTLREDTLAFLNNDKQLLINGEWVAPAEGGSMPTLNPANGETLLNFAIGTQADVDKAVDVARRALHGAWGQMTGDDRGRILWKIGELIEANIDMLAELETLDSGKPLESSKGEISNAAAQFRYFAGWASKIEGSTIPVSNPDELVYTIREPMGVVGIITPWNFPLLMVSWKLPAALATGNTVILKPAEQTPLTALALGNLALEAG
ncbi:MAG: aldehyde dehydrogenase family protein, partial [Chloroflexota bacterium]